jgi:hypothetical protein
VVTGSPEPGEELRVAAAAAGNPGPRRPRQARDLADNWEIRRDRLWCRSPR